MFINVAYTSVVNTLTMMMMICGLYFLHSPSLKRQWCLRTRVHLHLFFHCLV